MKNSDFTYENILMKVKDHVSYEYPSIILKSINLVVYGMVKNYGMEYLDDILAMLDSISFVFTDNKRDIYVKDVKNIKKYNYVNLFYEPNTEKYAIYIDYRLNELGILENLVLSFNEIFTISTPDITFKEVFNGIQGNYIMKYILELGITSSISVDHYVLSHHVGDTLFENLYQHKDIKKVIDSALINNNMSLLQYEFDSVLGNGSYHIIANLYESIQKLIKNDSDAYEIAIMYGNLRSVLQKYLYLKSI